MPRVRFVEQNVEVEVPKGSSILNAAQRSGAPEGSACGGVCACSTCHVYVEQGGELLSEASEDEEDILDKAFDVRPQSRLGCQARCADEDLIVEITPESRKAYFDEHPDEREKKKAG